MKASDIKERFAALTARIERLENRYAKVGRKKGTPQSEETKRKIAEGVRRAHERKTA